MSKKLDQKSLEDLAIAICKLQTEDGVRVNLFPQDVLVGWLAAYFPTSPVTFTLRLKPAMGLEE